jgi:hypothetical protein
MSVISSCNGQPPDAVVSARARRQRSWLALGFLMIATSATVAPAALAQSPTPSGSELREAYPLHEGTPPEAAGGARPTPAAEGRSATTPATRSSDGGSTPLVIAAGLALLAFAAGFGLPLARARSRPAASEAGDVGVAGSEPSQPRRFEPSDRSGDRSKPTAPRT